MTAIETVSELTNYLWQEICELPDRTSPEEYPDMGMVTLTELTAIVETYFERRADSEGGDACEQAASDALDFVMQKLPAIKKEKGLVGVWMNAWRLAWTASLSRRSLDTADGVDVAEALYDELLPLMQADAPDVYGRKVKAQAAILNALASRTRNTETVVKGLEWGGVDVNGERHAKSVFGTYTIRGRQGSMGFWLTQVGGYHQTVEAAKAAAQADFDQRIRSALASPPSPAEVTFQDRVAEAHVALFHDDPTDLPERRDRFYEEATEAVQSLGMTEDEAHQLVSYTYSRPPGDVRKEIGAAALTLASLCVVGGWDMMECAETDLAALRTPEKIAKVRAKRATRHGRGPLPGLDALQLDKKG